MKSRSEVLKLLESHRGDYLSGEAIAEGLGLSRSGVWKIIKQLRDEGYPIDAKNNRGYSLSPQSDLLSAEALQPLIKDKNLWPNIHVFNSLPSTNTQAKAYAQQGAPQGTAVLAREQTAGRGRLGRSFYSPKNTGLYLSLILRPQLRIDQSLYITAAVGVLLCQIISRVAGLDLQIKWVNDLYHEKRKVCGILTEAAADFESGAIEYLVLGIGINLSPPQDDFPEEIKDRAGVLFPDQSPERLNIKLAAEIINTLAMPEVFAPRDTLMAEYKKRSLVLGRPVTLTSGAQPSKTGTVVDFTPEGFLLLETEDGHRETISSGEVSLRLK